MANKRYRIVILHHYSVIISVPCISVLEKQLIKAFRNFEIALINQRIFYKVLFEPSVWVVDFFLRINILGKHVPSYIIFPFVREIYFIIVKFAKPCQILNRAACLFKCRCDCLSCTTQRRAVKVFYTFVGKSFRKKLCLYLSLFRKTVNFIIGLSVSYNQNSHLLFPL